MNNIYIKVKGKGCPYLITECRVPKLILILGGQPAGDVSHKPGGRLLLLLPGLQLAQQPIKRADTNFAAW